MQREALRNQSHLPRRNFLEEIEDEGDLDGFGEKGVGTEIAELRRSVAHGVGGEHGDVGAVERGVATQLDEKFLQSDMGFVFGDLGAEMAANWEVADPHPGKPLEIPPDPFRFPPPNRRRCSEGGWVLTMERCRQAKPTEQPNPNLRLC